MKLEILHLRNFLDVISVISHLHTKQNFKGTRKNSTENAKQIAKVISNKRNKLFSTVMIVTTSLSTNSMLRNTWQECTKEIFIDMLLISFNKSCIDNELNSLLNVGG